MFYYFKAAQAEAIETIDSTGIKMVSCFYDRDRIRISVLAILEVET